MTTDTVQSVRIERLDSLPLAMRQHWIDGSDPETGATFELSCGAGLGSSLMAIEVRLGDKRVVEKVDVTGLLTDRVRRAIEELTGG